VGAAGPGSSSRAAASDDAVRWPADGPQVHPVLHVVLLQLGQNVFAIGVLTQGSDVRPDLGEKRRASEAQEPDHSRVRPERAPGAARAECRPPAEDHKHA